MSAGKPENMRDPEDGELTELTAVDGSAAINAAAVQQEEGTNNVPGWFDRLHGN